MTEIEWTPQQHLGTWHPRGRRLIGPVVFVQRIDGRPTGLYFVVPRWRYWWISMLDSAVTWPIVGRVARAIRSRMQVLYIWAWPHHGPIGQA